ncbi:MAG: carboxylating nicotinate-nucleotide diphosphorylase [bacterium]|nr:MAG: carboxylating nicotinate-nucleotide diphosphorylase [bacterium]
MEETGEHIKACIERALDEDAARNDVTTALAVAPVQMGRAFIKAREAGVVSGQRVAEAVFRALDGEVSYETAVRDGERAEADCVVTRLEGRLRAILAGERTALNFLGRLCGIATLTARYVGNVAGSGVVILDTRKTTPGLRILEKEAVRHGGGRNHRIDLQERILVKENHITAAGGMIPLLERIGPERLQKAEIEVSCLAELGMLQGSPPAMVMLDNFTPDMIRSAVAELEQWDSPRPEIEVSGGITLETVASFAIPGVDYISIGSLTASAAALDLSLIVDEVWEP